MDVRHAREIPEVRLGIFGGRGQTYETNTRARSMREVASIASSQQDSVPNFLEDSRSPHEWGPSPFPDPREWALTMEDQLTPEIPFHRVGADGGS